jgi:ketosteroid isomerase-like protein
MFRRSLVILLVLAATAFPSLAATPEEEVRAAFEKFVAAQNAHDVKAVEALLLDSPQFLWITRGAAIWGREAALKRFESLYQGTWKLTPDSSSLKVIHLSDTCAQLYVPIMFNIGAPGQPAADAPTLINQIWVKTSAGWRIASILPIPLNPPAPASAK